MSPDHPDSILQSFSPTKVILPILLGLSVVIYMLVRNVDMETFESVRWSWAIGGWIAAACCMVGLRHFFLMYRIRRLTENKLGWWQTFEVISLWEFSSAATPSVVGGTAVAFFLLTKEKIKAGETITTVLFLIFLDGLFFIFSVPLLLFILGKGLLAPAFNMPELQQSGLFWLYMFIGGYLFMATYTLLIGYGLFYKPYSFRWLLINATKLPLLSRWHEQSIQMGDDVIVASKALRKKTWQYWWAGIWSSTGTWLARFMILNCVIMAFIAVSDHILLFGRQMVLYVLMLIPVTPGGSGLAEAAMGTLLADFFPQTKAGVITVNVGLAAVVALVWRLISYYAYLLLGVLVLPNWVRRVFSATPQSNDEEQPPASDTTQNPETGAKKLLLSNRAEYRTKVKM